MKYQINDNVSKNQSNFGQDIGKVVGQIIKHSLNPQNGQGIGQALTQVLQAVVYPQYGNYNFEERNGENHLKTTFPENHSYRVSYSPIIVNDKHNKHQKNCRNYDLNQRYEEHYDPYCGCDGNYYQEIHQNLL